MAPGALSARLLGLPRFTWRDRPVTPGSSKGLALLCYLACREEGAPREHLAELLWGVGKLHNLRQALLELRRLPGAEGWLEEADGIRLEVRSDLSLFETALKEGRAEEALELWRGAPFEGVTVRNAPPFEAWLELERARLTQLYSEAQTKALESLEAGGRFDDALGLAGTLLTDDPLNETAHRTVMRLYWRRGDTAAALESFERLREILRDELGVEPLPETLALLADIEGGGEARGARARLIERPGAVPALPERLFGREELLRRARAGLGAGARVLLHGFGGAGKTALAAHLTRDHLTQTHATREGRALWLELGNEEPETAFDALAAPFEAQQRLAQADDKAAALGDLLSEHGVTLLVLDDVWNAYTLSRVAEALPAGLPLLVTSRGRYPRLKRLDVGRLGRPAARFLLNHHARRDVADEGEALCDLLGDHAYALRIAGITLAEERLTPDELITRIRRAPHLLSLPEGFEGESVAGLLQVSLEALDDPAYEAFLAFGGLPTPSATPELLARALRRETDATEDALFSLVQRGLAERNAPPGQDAVAFRVHDLSYTYARTRTPVRPQSAARAALGYLETHKDDVLEVELELPNLLSAAEGADEAILVRFMRLLTVDGTYYSARGHSARSLALSERAIEAAKALEDWDAAQYMLGKLGDVHLKFLGNYERTFEAYTEGLEIVRRLGNRSREAIFLGIIGVVRFHQEADDYGEYLDEAYRVAKASEDLLSLCNVLEQRGYVAATAGNGQKSQMLYRETLEVLTKLEKTNEVESGEVARGRFFALLNLGEAEHLLREYEQAFSTRKQALRIARACQNQMWEAHALQEIGEMQHSLGNRKEAQEHFMEALEIYQSNHANSYVKSLTTFMKEADYQILY